MMYSRYAFVGVPLHTARIACWFSRATTHWSNFCTCDGIDSQTVLRTICESKRKMKRNRSACNLVYQPGNRLYGLNRKLKLTSVNVMPFFISELATAAVGDISLSCSSLRDCWCPESTASSVRRFIIDGFFCELKPRLKSHVG